MMGDYMKLMIMIINNEDVKNVTDALVKQKFSFTKLSSTGGVLHTGNTTLLLGVEDKNVEVVKAIVSEHAKSRRKKITPNEPGELNVLSFMPGSVVISGATLFVLNVEDYVKY